MSVVECRRLCPNIRLVQADNNSVDGTQRYRSAGQKVLRAIMQALPGMSRAGICHADSWVGRKVENPSFDDVFILFTGEDATRWCAAHGLPASHASCVLRVADQWATHARRCIFEETGLRCSAGIAKTVISFQLLGKLCSLTDALSHIETTFTACDKAGEAERTILCV